ncbi:hypothetical protein Dcar01_01721 [Deinococcus carri]|uniref:Uncharacterized protein n=1 Tax=Deinococcus carri TaxID=1211323 RepID=A0ABP9W6J9_9DEIO
MAAGLTVATALASLQRALRRNRRAMLAILGVRQVPAHPAWTLILTRLAF